MLKRPLCGLAIGFLLGTLNIMTGTWYCILTATAVIVAVAVGAYRQKQCKRGVFVVLLFFGAFLLGNSHCQQKKQIRENCQSQIIDGMHLMVQGTLDSKEYKNHQYIYYLKDCFASFQTGVLPCNQIIAYSNTDTESIGKTLIINGTIENFQIALNEGNFDEKAYYASRGIDFKLTNITIEASYGKENKLHEALFCFRQKVRQVYEAYMSGEDAGVMSTMTLGDKSLLDAEIKELYQGAGISHILAISGLHISVIGMSLYKLLRRIGLPYGAAGLAAGSIMIAYGVMTGLSASTMRAVLMFLLMLLAQVLGRSYDTLTALSVAAVILLWENPFLVEYAGFLFSFAAVLGVVIVGKNLEKTFLPKKKLAKTLLVSVSIQLATLPLAAFFYYEIPVYTMLINLFVLPFLNVLLFLGIAGGILGLRIGFAAKICFLPCHWILYLYRKLCEICELLPGANFITGKPGIFQMLLYYAILAGVLLLFWRKMESDGQSESVMQAKNVKQSENVKQTKNAVQYKFVMQNQRKKSGFILLTSLAAMFGILFWNPTKELEIDVLCVGQGDGIFLQTGQGHHIFIDGGSTDVKKVGTYRILPFLKAKGIKEIDYWLVTHTDTDHISGLKELLEEGYSIETLVFSAEIKKDDSYLELQTLAEQNGTEIMLLKQGDCMHFGEGKLTCLFPDEDYKSDDKNAMSLVVSYEEGEFLGIFTGDIDAASEERLSESGRLSEVTFYKAAHHGSKYSNSAEFLEVLRPEISVVSCSKNNSYGHPGKEALANMEAVGSRIFYTMESGQITIKMNRKGMNVYGYKE